MSLQFPSKIWTRIRKDFDFRNVEPDKFFSSEWELRPHHDEDEDHPGVNNDNDNDDGQKPRVSLPYLIYRGLFAIILLSCITFSTTCQSHLFHIFLTNWSFTLQNVYGISFFCSVFWRWWTFSRRATGTISKPISSQVEIKMQPDSIVKIIPDGTDKKGLETHDDEPSKKSTTGLPLTPLEKWIWLLINVVHVLPYCVVLGYWCLVYKHNPDQPYCERFRSHYIVHGATAFLALIDVIVVAIPARVAHSLIPTGLVFLYVVFTCLYEAAGGPYREGKPYIYSILDWKNNPQKAVFFSTLAIFVTPIAHLIFCYGLYKLRVTVKERIIFRRRNNTSRGNGSI